MKGIILAGGSGTHLYPLTQVVSKHLLPCYDKPIIYYPLSLLILAGIREILIISTPRDLPLIRDMLGGGEHLGLTLHYAVQPRQGGVAEAILIGETFLAGQPVCLVLGDNFFYGHDMALMLSHAASLREGGHIFASQVRNPERYGVVEFDTDFRVISLEEKPRAPRSNWAVPGIYFYDECVVEIARGLVPSARGELEITDVNKAYLRSGRLSVSPLGRGISWLDMGTPESLLAASQFVQTLEHRTGLKIGCPEEIALHRGLVDYARFENLIRLAGPGEYGKYLLRVLQEHRALVPPARGQAA